MGVLLLPYAHGAPIEDTVARTFVRGYAQNEERLHDIDLELKGLPRPYLREPTGTGGFLTHAQESSTNEIAISLRWKEPVELDAVALFPLRLFMDEIYAENLYWPDTITIKQELDGELIPVAHRENGQPLIRQSLPELITFDPITTSKLVILCTDLPEHPHEKWHAAGFAEICVFSGAANLAPRANVRATHSRQGYHVLAREYLVDAQGHAVRTDSTYKNFPLRTPGLNAYFAYFPETIAQSVRLTVLAASQPVPEAMQAIAFSEVTALHRGFSVGSPASLEEQFSGVKSRLNLSDPLDTDAKQSLASACDGLTHSGRMLPLREWTEGLVRRQQLMEEQFVLEGTQQKSIVLVRRTLIYGSLALLMLVAAAATSAVVRSRVRLRKTLRATQAKIASDLHDDVGSNLGTIVLHTGKLQKIAHSPEEHNRLHSILRLTRESVFGLREVLSTTAPEVGRTQNLVTYMNELAGLILGKTPYTFESGPAMSEALLEHSLRKGILLFYKEALYNAKRHSDCSQVDISIRRAEGDIVLRIRDNGKGIGEEAMKKPRTLRTLKQRAEWLGADLKIKTEPDGGTDLLLSIPA